MGSTCPPDPQCCPLCLTRTNCSSRSHHAPSFSPNPPSEKRPSSPLQFGQVASSHGQYFERRAYWFVLIVIGYPFFPQAVLMITLQYFAKWLTIHSCVTNTLYDKYMLFAHLMQGKKIEAWFLSLVSIELHSIEPLIFLSTNWQKNAKKIWTAKHVFHRYSY